MLPPNLVNNTQNNDNENESKQIPKKPVPPIPKKAPPIPSAVNNIQKSNPRNNQGTQTNNNNTSRNRETFRRIIYITYDNKTIENTIKIHSSLEVYTSIFPTGVIIHKPNKVLYEVGFLVPLTCYVTTDNIDISNLITEIQSQYYTNNIINLSLYNMVLNPKFDNTLINLGFLPVRTALFSEFMPTFKELLKLFTEGQLKNYELPEHLLLPLPVFSSSNNDPFDIQSSMSRLCTYLQSYLTYDKENELLYLQLSNIEGCQYNEYLDGIYLTVPINKLTARLLYSAIE